MLLEIITPALQLHISSFLSRLSRAEPALYTSLQMEILQTLGLL